MFDAQTSAALEIKNNLCFSICPFKVHETSQRTNKPLHRKYKIHLITKLANVLRVYGAYL